MKDFQRMYKTLKVNPGETKTLVISRTEAANNRFTFVFNGISSGDLYEYVKIWILAGAADKKVNLTDCAEDQLKDGSYMSFDCGHNACIFIVDFPIVSDIEISITGPSNGVSLSIHAGNY
jgi:hypothetical protein